MQREACVPSTAPFLTANLVQVRKIPYFCTQKPSMTELETSEKVVLLGQSETELKQLAQEMGMPAFVGKQMAQWLYAKGVMTIDEMTNISKNIILRHKTLFMMMI